MKNFPVRFLEVMVGGAAILVVGSVYVEGIGGSGFGGWLWRCREVKGEEEGVVIHCFGTFIDDMVFTLTE